MEKINWKTFNGNYIPIKQMTTTHIINTYNCLKGKSLTIIPQNWCGRTHLEWEKIFENELKNRGFTLAICIFGINTKFTIIKIQN